MEVTVRAHSGKAVCDYTGRSGGEGLETRWQEAMEGWEGKELRTQAITMFGRQEHESLNFFFRFPLPPLAASRAHGCRMWGGLNVSGAKASPSMHVGSTQDPAAGEI